MTTTEMASPEYHNASLKWFWEDKNFLKVKQGLALGYYFRMILCSYCLNNISIRAKRSIFRDLSLLIVPSPFSVHCPFKGCIIWGKAVLPVIYGFCHCFLERKKAEISVRQQTSYQLACISIRANPKPAAIIIPSLRSGITSGLGLCIRPYRYAGQLVRRQ